MFQLDKISQIVTVSPDMTLEEYEKALNREGFTGGYRSLLGDEVKLGECLSKRIPNYYFLKYGGIEELCVGGDVVSPKGQRFTIKTAPRAATGPDLKKVLIGSEGLLGEFKVVSLKIYPIPEESLWGLSLFDHPHQTTEILRKMLTYFIHPLFVRMMDEEESTGLLRSLNLPDENKMICAFKLTGLRTIIEAQKDAILRSHEGDHVFFYWPTQKAETDIMDETLITPEAFDSLLAKCHSLIGTNPRAKESEGEKELREFFSRHPAA